MPPRKRAPSKAASAKSTANADEPTPVDPVDPAPVDAAPDVPTEPVPAEPTPEDPAPEPAPDPAPLDPYERVEVELAHGASVVPRPGGHTYLWPLDGGTIEVDPADLDVILELLGDDATVHRSQIEPPLAPVAPDQDPVVLAGDVGPAVVEAPEPVPCAAVVEVVGPNVVEVPVDTPDDA